jgi:hypothetical protein
MERETEPESQMSPDSTTNEPPGVLGQDIRDFNFLSFIMAT